MAARVTFYGRLARIGETSIQSRAFAWFCGANAMLQRNILSVDLPQPKDYLCTPFRAVQQGFLHGDRAFSARFFHQVYTEPSP